MDYRQHHSTRGLPQSQRAPGTVKNSAGGYAFPVDDWARLSRFLILGAEGGTYYASEQKLTRESAQAVQRCIDRDGVRVVETLTTISCEGRAPKNDPALFVLAMCTAAADPKTRRAAFAAVPLVARTGTHLFHFVHFAEGFRGWGRGLKQAVARWYNKPADALAYQAIKYKSRDGWSHRDMLRLSHARTRDPDLTAIYEWICRPDQEGSVHPQIDAARGTVTPEVIREFKLPREAVPTDMLNDPATWDALLEDMPLTAMIRNLGKMSQIGLLTPTSTQTKEIVTRLSDEQWIKQSRVHPLAILLALKTYSQGQGFRGSLTWDAVPAIADALNDAFYTAFQNVEPTGKRVMLALDVSGSMTYPMAGTVLSCREASAAMAMVTAAVEPDHHIVAFADGDWDAEPGRSRRWYGSRGIAGVSLSPRQRLDDVVSRLQQMDWGGTDCALPMLYALAKKIEVDAFVIYTDSETWAGDIHPFEALKRYRNKTGIAARLVVVGMTSNGFSIADPNDGGMLDVVGFDTATPAVISNFIKGDV